MGFAILRPSYSIYIDSQHLCSGEVVQLFFGIGGNALTEIVSFAEDCGFLSPPTCNYHKFPISGRNPS